MSNEDKTHKCLENKEIVYKYPLYGGSYGNVFVEGYPMDVGIKYKCGICQLTWHEQVS